MKDILYGNCLKIKIENIWCFPILAAFYLENDVIIKREFCKNKRKQNNKIGWRINVQHKKNTPFWHLRTFVRNRVWLESPNDHNVRMLGQRDQKQHGNHCLQTEDNDRPMS